MGRLRLRSGYLVGTLGAPASTSVPRRDYLRGGIMPGSGSFASSLPDCGRPPAGFIAPGQNSYFLSFGHEWHCASSLLRARPSAPRPVAQGSGYCTSNNVIYFEG